MILCDTGIVIEIALADEKTAAAYRSAFTTWDETILTTWPCVTEAMHIVGKRGGGWYRQRKVSGLITGSLLSIYDIPHTKVSRLFALMEQYRDRPMDLADASLVLVAETTGVRRILTIDSDFLVYRINNRDSFRKIDIV